ncbi:probable disease resistance protein At4g27220 [Prosopis cineraria]|uniref:probable disease resistance protein At4g27220 n=1 Tax=Prosopis cineraria TaxID=364024 RepID=UPI0024102228|nr:probable disease resistance protein At4g27220 [Prosopis cineraria]
MHSPEINKHEQEYVTMHDMVRDVALWIASKQDHTIKVNYTKELNEFLDNEAIKDFYAIASWYDLNGLLQFPSRLDAPKLEILLFDSSTTFDLSLASFEGTKELKVFAVIHRYSYPSLMKKPQSIQQLSNLRTLRLQHWDLGDISFVVSLTRLEILDLKGSEFEKLPNGIEKLNKLKMLDLSRCKIDECCYKVIGRCSHLEELYVYPHFSHLENINCFEYLQGVPALTKLKRYKLEMGKLTENARFFWREERRSLCLGHPNISMSSALIKDIVQRATAIQFYKLLGGCKSFIPNMVQAMGGMNELTKLHLQCCSEMECIADETTLMKMWLSQDWLESLGIFNCPQLLHIFPVDCNLRNLKFLDIVECPMLTSLFPVSVACTLLSLEKLYIENCIELKHLIEVETGGDQNEIQIVLPPWNVFSFKIFQILLEFVQKGVNQGSHL